MFQFNFIVGGEPGAAPAGSETNGPAAAPPPEGPPLTAPVKPPSRFVPLDLARDESAAMLCERIPLARLGSAQSETSLHPVPALFRRTMSDVSFELASQDPLTGPDDPAPPSLPTPAASPIPVLPKTAVVGSRANQALSALQSDSDLAKGVYEGGLKTWECSLDLIEYLATQLAAPGSRLHELCQASQSSNPPRPCRVLELGCGAGLPGVYLAAALLSPASLSSRTCPAPRVHVTFQDFNPEVLYLVTMPNLALTLSAQAQTQALPNNHAEATADTSEEPAERFQEHAVAWRPLSNSALGESVSFVAGDWSTLPILLAGAPPFDLIVTSETIYDADNHAALYACLTALLARTGLVLLAAKRMYFGCSGSLLDFLALVDARRELAWTRVMEHDSKGKGGGVARDLIQLTWLKG